MKGDPLVLVGLSLLLLTVGHFFLRVFIRTLKLIDSAGDDDGSVEAVKASWKRWFKDLFFPDRFFCPRRIFAPIVLVVFGFGLLLIITLVVGVNSPNIAQIFRLGPVGMAQAEQPRALTFSEPVMRVEGTPELAPLEALSIDAGFTAPQSGGGEQINTKEVFSGLVATLGTVLVVWALYLQQNEIREQRKEGLQLQEILMAAQIAQTTHNFFERWYDARARLKEVCDPHGVSVSHIENICDTLLEHKHRDDFKARKNLVIDLLEDMRSLVVEFEQAQATISKLRGREEHELISPPKDAQIEKIDAQVRKLRD